MAGRGDNELMTRPPDFVTHYYRADRMPFQNLSDLDDPELSKVLRDLSEPTSRSLSHRRFGPRYMNLRRATEEAARQLFTAAGGQPIRRGPYYFVLGESGWFAGLYLDVRTFQIALDALPMQATSFTLTDSITALGLGQPLGVPAAPWAHERQLYRLDQLDQIIGRYGMPENCATVSYADHQRQLLHHFVEVQLWSDEPLATELEAPVARAPRAANIPSTSTGAAASA